MLCINVFTRYYSLKKSQKVFATNIQKKSTTKTDVQILFNYKRTIYV